MQTKEFVKLLGIIYKPKVCDKCGEEVRYQVIITRNWKMLGIPLIPVSTEYKLCCPKCGNRVIIDKTQARQYLDSIAKEKRNHTHEDR